MAMAIMHLVWLTEVPEGEQGFTQVDMEKFLEMVVAMVLMGVEPVAALLGTVTTEEGNILPPELGEMEPYMQVAVAAATDMVPTMAIRPEPGEPGAEETERWVEELALMA